MRRASRDAAEGVSRLDPSRALSGEHPMTITQAAHQRFNEPPSEPSDERSKQPSDEPLVFLWVRMRGLVTCPSHRHTVESQSRGTDPRQRAARPRVLRTSRHQTSRESAARARVPHCRASQLWAVGSKSGKGGMHCARQRLASWRLRRRTPPSRRAWPGVLIPATIRRGT